MCGILGIVTSPESEDVDLRTLIRCIGLWQYHRGPDGWGEWIANGVALGQNRLAILDVPLGKQPMASADGRVQVVFNGEIYNYLELWSELKSKGYRFRTDHSDTEVIVHGYCEWGADVFSRLEGMFAIGIWDAARRKLVLARDRLGIKPVYYAPTSRGLVFASEPKTILASGWITPRLAAESLPDYFMFRAPLGAETLFEGIRSLPPGSWCDYDRSTGIGPHHRYWEPRETRLAERAESLEHRVEKVIDDAALSHLAADVPVGIFLSGGVDSSLLAALVSRHARLDAFTVGTHSKLEESGYATQVANRLGLPLHVRFVTGDDFRARFDDWCYFNDDPVSDPSALALMLITEHAREHGMKVMLAGEGADELFGGYHSYIRLSAYSRLSRLPLKGPAAALLRMRARGVDRDYLSSLDDLHFFGSAHVLQARDRRHLFNGAMSASIGSWERRAFPQCPTRGSVARSAMLFDQVTRLPNDLLPRTDRATMAYSLEARVPYLDRRVVELANGLSQSDSVRLVPPSGKPLLKRIAARHVPRRVVYRHKRGFNLPVERWLTIDFRDRIESFLRERRISELDYDYIRSVYDIHTHGEHQAALLWAWLVLEQWHRLWIDGEAVPCRPAIVADEEAYRLLLHANERTAAAAAG
jgi:asparagine synthase (glutamine-hydrolysing)